MQRSGSKREQPDRGFWGLIWPDSTYWPLSEIMLTKEPQGRWGAPSPPPILYTVRSTPPHLKKWTSLWMQILKITCTALTCYLYAKHVRCKPLPRNPESTSPQLPPTYTDLHGSCDLLSLVWSTASAHITEGSPQDLLHHFWFLPAASRDLGLCIGKPSHVSQGKRRLCPTWKHPNCQGYWFNSIYQIELKEQGGGK